MVIKLPISGYHLLLLILLIIPSKVNGQQTDFSIELLYGSYDLSHQKTLQSELYGDIVRSTGLSAEKTDVFPSYFGWRTNINHFGSTFIYTVSLEYLTTGGRIAYQDRTGGFEIDQILKRYGIMFGMGDDILNKDRFILTANLLIGFGYTVYNVDSEYNLTGSATSDDSSDFFAYNGIILPKLVGRYELVKEKLILNATCGYEIGALNSPLYLKDDKDFFLNVSGNTPARANWSGFRFGLGIGLILSKN